MTGMKHTNELPPQQQRDSEQYNSLLFLSNRDTGKSLMLHVYYLRKTATACKDVNSTM